MQHLVAFRDQNRTNQESEKLHISSHNRARGNINLKEITNPALLHRNILSVRGFIEMPKERVDKKKQKL
jgi:hypothetical protein